MELPRSLSRSSADVSHFKKILDAYPRKELAAWARRFPDEFYRQIFRLRGWEWKGRKINPPQVVAKYTNDFIYDRLGARGYAKSSRGACPRATPGARRGGCINGSPTTSVIRPSHSTFTRSPC